MDPLEKLKIIVKARIAEIKKEYEISKGEHSQLCLDSLNHEWDTLRWVWTRINAIKQNAPGVSDDTLS